MKRTLNLVAVIGGTDYPVEYTIHGDGDVRPYYRNAAVDAIHKAGLKAKRNDPQTVEVRVYLLHIVGTDLKRKLLNTYHLTPPLEAMTDTEFETEQTALLADLPAEFHPFVRQTAWDHGHSAGYEEVINYVRDMVGNLKPCVDKYTANLKGKK
jgi:hypothetical protein